MTSCVGDEKRIMFSLIVPVYNCEKYLRDCLTAITRQTYSELEIVLVNDGSVDASEAICREYAKIDSRIVVYSQKNSGPSSARNKGIQLSHGEYIMFVDADDLIPENVCEMALSQIPNYDVVMFGWKGFREHPSIGKETIENIQPVELSNRTKKEWVHALLGKKDGAEMAGVNAATVWAKVYRRDFLINNAITFPEKIFFGEDMVFNLLVCMSKPRACYLSEEAYYYRYNEDSIVHRYNPEFIKQTKECWNEIERILVNEGLWGSVQTDIMYRRMNDLILALSNDVFHKDNNKNRRTKKADFFELVSQDEYQSIDALKLYGFSPYERHVIHLALNRKYMLLKVEYVMRDIVRRIRKYSASLCA